MQPWAPHPHQMSRPLSVFASECPRDGGPGLAGGVAGGRLPVSLPAKPVTRPDEEGTVTFFLARAAPDQVPSRSWSLAKYTTYESN